MPRKIKVATTAWSHQPPTPAADNVDYACELLEAGGGSGVDVCVLPEGLNFIGLSQDDQLAHVEPGIPGPTSERFSEIARKHEMYVVAGLYNYR
jgi:predicted amidohydrolase